MIFKSEDSFPTEIVIILSIDETIIVLSSFFFYSTDYFSFSSICFNFLAFSFVSNKI